MIKYTNFLRKYVTIMPLFYEKTHFFKKKSRKTALKSSRRPNSNDARNAHRGLTYVTTLAHKHEKPMAKNCTKARFCQAQNGDLNLINCVGQLFDTYRW